MNEQNPALIAARDSWRCVQARDKAGWLDLMADEIVMEDPIGLAVTNPDGRGVRGREAVSAFWDRHMATSKIQIETHRSFEAGLESAHLMTLSTSFANGVSTRVTGIFTYRVNDAGKLLALRGYWSVEDMEVRQSGPQND